MKKILFISAVVLGFTLSACDSYLDINEDPNSPSAGNIETDMLMPAIEMNIASSYGNFLRIAGGFHSNMRTCSVPATTWTIHSSTCQQPVAAVRIPS